MGWVLKAVGGDRGLLLFGLLLVVVVSAGAGSVRGVGQAVWRAPESREGELYVDFRSAGRWRSAGQQEGAAVGARGDCGGAHGC